MVDKKTNAHYYMNAACVRLGRVKNYQVKIDGIVVGALHFRFLLYSTAKFDNMI